MRITGFGVFALGLSGVVAMAAFAGVPPNPTRTSPPPGIEERAVKVGSEAPALALPSSTGGAFDLVAALEKGPAVVIFYRGFW